MWKTAFKKFYLVHSLIHCLTYLQCFQTPDICKHTNTPIAITLVLETFALKWHELLSPQVLFMKWPCNKIDLFSVLKLNCTVDLKLYKLSLFSLWQPVFPFQDHNNWLSVHENPFNAFPLAESKNLSSPFFLNISIVTILAFSHWRAGNYSFNQNSILAAIFFALFPHQ